MLKKILVSIFFLTFILEASTIRLKTIEQAPMKQEALDQAYWALFEQALDKVAGKSSYSGNIKNSFRSDLEKDSKNFIVSHFRNRSEQCTDNAEDGYKCLVRATVNVEKLKAILSEKANSTTTMGRDSVENLDIVLIDKVRNKLSKDFTTNLQASINDTGNSLRVEKKWNTKKSSKTNYLFELTNLEFTNLGKDAYNATSGTLNYRISMVNVQTGKKDLAIRSKAIKGFASNEKNLRFKLYEEASNVAAREITDNILKSISKKNRTKKMKKIQKFEHFYTVILAGLTGDGEDRGKLKLIRDSIKKMKAKPIKNVKESKDFEQVYNFGTNAEIDIEDFTYEIYDLADALGFQIKIRDLGDNIVEVQFQ